MPYQAAPSSVPQTLARRLSRVAIAAVITLSFATFAAPSKTFAAEPTPSVPEKIAYETARNVPYYSAETLETADDYQKSQCRVDVLYPKKPGFSTIVWFHGGGLTGGSKYFPSAFKRLKSFENGDLAIVAVGYRLSPKVPFPVFIEDAARAVAWTLQNIAEYGGNPDAVFVSGGSAGGYLSAMLGARPEFLAANGVDRADLAGLLPVSGQMTTHFHVKELLKYPGDQYNPVIDVNAPLAGISKDYPPTFFILGDRKIEWKCRVEENELMFASLKALGAPLVQFSENEGFTHGISGMGDDIKPELLAEIDAFILKANELKKSRQNAAEDR